ncbi:MAG TPA: glutaminyl-peptide cyclotransferase [Bacteroidales bacterium]
MKNNYLKSIILFSVVLFLAWTISCSGRPEKKSDAGVKSASILNEEVSSKLIKIISPEENTGFKLHEPVKVVLSLADNRTVPDSVTVYFNGNVVSTIKSAPWEYVIPPVFSVTCGRKSLKVTAYKAGKPQNTITRFMIIYSDMVPKKYGYKVIHTYPHDRDAFTQGLVYDNGVLFEGTGQESGSTLREVELETGKVIRQHNLDGSLFGEGIALYRDQIYQVTWRNKVGFIYNKSDFKLINKIYYPTEGWGMTTMNDKIVLSDGSNVLYFYEPEMFTVISKIEVYDNKMKRDSLNELEYINGEIWANIWVNNHIARIDPVTGKVLGYIDLNGILPTSDHNAETDVLNGIAYDNKAKRIFVTGKRWPKLFEIKVTE